MGHLLNGPSTLWLLVLEPPGVLLGVCAQLPAASKSYRGRCPLPSLVRHIARGTRSGFARDTGHAGGPEAAKGSV